MLCNRLATETRWADGSVVSTVAAFPIRSRLGQGDLGQPYRRTWPAGLGSQTIGRGPHRIAIPSQPLASRTRCYCKVLNIHRTIHPSGRRRGANAAATVDATLLSMVSYAVWSEVAACDMTANSRRSVACGSSASM